jgi:hypothetical protein
MLSRPLFRTVLPPKPPRKHETRARDHAFAGSGPDVVFEPARESMAPPTQESALCRYFTVYPGGRTAGA